MSKESNIFVPERTVKYFFVTLICSTIIAIIIWPLIDLIFDKISNTEFSYNVIDHILVPFFVMLVMTIIEFATWGVWHKKSGK